MLLIKAVTAFMAVSQMMDQEQDFNTAYTLLTLKRKLQPHAEFFTQNELKLASEYGEQDEKGNVIYDEIGRFKFKSPEAGMEYNRKKIELGSVEVEEDWTKKSIKRPERIKPAQLEALQDFIVFEE